MSNGLPALPVMRNVWRGGDMPKRHHTSGTTGRSPPARRQAAAKVKTTGGHDWILARDVPMEPPTFCPVLTMADATPALDGATPAVPVFIDGDITKPRPVDASSSGGDEDRQVGGGLVAV